MDSDLTRNVEGALFPPRQDAWLLSDGSSSKAFITDPDAIMSTDGVHRVYVGSVFRAGAGDTLLGIAQRFRTTVKTLMAMNPDIEGNKTSGVKIVQKSVRK
jgi:LysM repeat protein